MGTLMGPEKVEATGLLKPSIWVRQRVLQGPGQNRQCDSVRCDDILAVKKQVALPVCFPCSMVLLSKPGDLIGILPYSIRSTKQTANTGTKAILSS